MSIVFLHRVLKFSDNQILGKEFVQNSANINKLEFFLKAHNKMGSHLSKLFVIAKTFS